ncbi:MAG: hypothetical protein HFI32_02860 [Lachnospiraceae bacterium]|nr:hypothetical protein [Lachnospiraceae bacterium]
MIVMSSRMAGELELFAQAFVWGMTMMLAYDGLSLLRLLFRHGTALLAVEDLCYWIVYSILLFRMMYVENDGMIRGFALLAVLLGTILYFQLKKAVISVEKKLQNKIKDYIIKNRRKNR